jgi:hypothetical protein
MPSPHTYQTIVITLAGNSTTAEWQCARYNKIMSLTEEDISQIRDVVVSAIQDLVLPRFDEHDRSLEALDNRLARLESNVKAVEIDMRQVKGTLGKLEGYVEALHADVKELFAMVAAQKPSYIDKVFAKQSIEQKVLRITRM